MASASWLAQALGINLQVSQGCHFGTRQVGEQLGEPKLGADFTTHLPCVHLLKACHALPALFPVPFSCAVRQPMLAVGGASGIIIGLATQQVLSNFVSGLNIFLARYPS